MIQIPSQAHYGGEEFNEHGYHMNPCGPNDGLLTEPDKLQIFRVQPSGTEAESTSMHLQLQDVQGETQLVCSKTSTTCLL